MNLFFHSLLLALSILVIGFEEKLPNILIIMVDDLRPELKSFGVDYIHSPNIDHLASEGISFVNHFVNSPSCGPSRYTFLMGKYGPAGNDAIFQRSKFQGDGEKVDPSLPEWFKSNGYTTASIGKVSHHPGGMGGERWNDANLLEMPKSWNINLMPTGEWEDPRGAMHGLAFGETREISSEMDVFQSVDSEDTDYPDGLITEKAVEQIQGLAKAENPFFLTVGLIKPHLPFGSPAEYMEHYKNIKLPPILHPSKPEHRSTWHGSGEFRRYNLWDKDPVTDSAFADEVRKHYAAAISYADAQLGKILKALEDSGEAENTVIILWGDHGWHLGEHGIWGKHSLFDESLRSPLIILYPEMNRRGAKSDAFVETVDLFPTLCELSGIETPDFVQGVSLVENLRHPESEGHAVFGYTPNAFTLRSETYRIIQHSDGYIELYDHSTAEKETRNLAGQRPQLVDSLRKIMSKKIKLIEIFD
ncbi:sulfatase [Algoriphagus sediminis]|uniref:Sulfatase n=1 Tax=Algoriphagus sediminis TaxID=3057113 RepID=A0ABT7Y919_9BACT|nr:sulfatase [Algoriphagus sediminis]MDN3202920.1 sulfatase [Algoriphagus sediminis]